MEFKADSNDIDRVIRFLIDYFLFFNPDVKQESVYVRLDFAPMAVNEGDQNQDWMCTFLPDGSVADPEQFSKCLEVVHSYAAGSAANK